MSSFSFGQKPAAGGFGFGQQAAGAQQSSAGAGFGFGQQAAGAQQKPAAGGFGFGQQAAGSQQTPAGSGFGLTQTGAAGSAGGFGQPQAAQQSVSAEEVDKKPVSQELINGHLSHFKRDLEEREKYIQQFRQNPTPSLPELSHHLVDLEYLLEKAREAGRRTVELRRLVDNQMKHSRAAFGCTSMVMSGDSGRMLLEAEANFLSSFIQEIEEKTKSCEAVLGECQSYLRAIEASNSTPKSAVDRLRTIIHCQNNYFHSVQSMLMQLQDEVEGRKSLLQQEWQAQSGESKRDFDKEYRKWLKQEQRKKETDFSKFDLFPQQQQPAAAPSQQGGFSGGLGGGMGGTNSFGGGFSMSAAKSGGFGASSAGGFGASSTGGFGASSAGGFGAPSAGGFGMAKSAGFGASSAGGFGAPSTGGFGATPAAGGFGAAAGSSGGGLAFGRATSSGAALGGGAANPAAAGSFGFNPPGKRQAT